MSATQSLFGPSTVKSRSTRSGAGRCLGSRTVVEGRLRRLTPCRPAIRIRRATRLRPTYDTLIGQFGMHPRRAIGSPRASDEICADASAQDSVFRAPASTRSLEPRVVSAGGDTQHSAHRGHRGSVPGWPSRIRRSGWHRAGLPSEPGRGFCQNFPFLAQPPDFPSQAGQLIPLDRCQALMAQTVVAIGLLHPVLEWSWLWARTLWTAHGACGLP